MKPSTKPNSSLKTFATGANELVVQAPETTVSEPSNVSWLVLNTIVLHHL